MLLGCVRVGRFGGGVRDVFQRLLALFGGVLGGQKQKDDLLRSVAQTYLRPKLGHGFLFFDVLGSNFGLPDLSSWENIQFFTENSNPTSNILDFLT